MLGNLVMTSIAGYPPSVKRGRREHQCDLMPPPTTKGFVSFDPEPGGREDYPPPLPALSGYAFGLSAARRWARKGFSSSSSLCWVAALMSALTLPFLLA